VKSLFRTQNVFLAVLFLGITAMAFRNVTDPDVGWHIKTGEWMVHHHAVPHADIFSFTRAGAPWIAHEWLSELLIYAVFRWTAWNGLIVLFALVLTATFLLLYIRCSSSRYLAGLFTLAGAHACVPTWDVRPQVLSFFLASVWLLILEHSESNSRLLWWTLPLTVLWVNLHAAFLLGPALLALVLVGELYERIFGSGTRVSGAHLRTMALVLAFNLLLVPLNPNGWKMFSYPLETLRSPSMQRYISEWNSPNFHNPDYWPLLLAILAVFMIAASARSRMRPRDLLLLLVGTLAALSFVRMTPIFVLIAVPIASRLIQDRPRLQGSAPSPSRPFSTVGNIAILLAMTAFVIVHASQVLKRQPLAEAAHYPVAATRFLQSHPPGRLFNSYDWGGYLIFHLYPETRVCIDGRADVFGDGAMQEFFDAYFMTGNWQRALSDWKIETVLVPPTAPLASALRTQPAWQLRFEDPTALVFSRRDAMSSALSADWIRQAARK
jgi:hypothetical protein